MTGMRARILQHVPFESPGSIAIAASTSTWGGSRRVSRASVRNRGSSRSRSSAAVAEAGSLGERGSSPSNAEQAWLIQKTGSVR